MLRVLPFSYCWYFVLQATLRDLGVTSQKPRSQIRPAMVIDPPVLVLKTAGEVLKEVELRCGTPTPPDDRLQRLVSLTLERRMEETRPDITDPQVIMKARTENAVSGDAQLMAIGGIANWSVSGFVTPSSTVASIGVTIKRAGCWDAGRYTCQLEYYSDTNNTRKAVVYASTYLSVDPMDMQVDVTPDINTVQPAEGMQINITCSGNVGSIRQDVYTIEWVWEFQDLTAVFPKWKDYDGNDTDIVEPFPAKKESCFERRYTMLSRVLTADDTKRVYRCFFRRVESVVKADDFHNSVRVVSIPDFLRQPHFSSKNMAVICILFGVVALLCVTALGTYACRRKRARQKKVQAEIEEIHQRLEEKRRTLATLIEKRISVYVGDNLAETQKLDDLINKLNILVASGPDPK